MCLRAPPSGPGYRPAHAERLTTVGRGAVAVAGAGTSRRSGHRRARRGGTGPAATPAPRTRPAGTGPGAPRVAGATVEVARAGHRGVVGTRAHLGARIDVAGGRARIEARLPARGPGRAAGDLALAVVWHAACGERLSDMGDAAHVLAVILRPIAMAFGIDRLIEDTTVGLAVVGAGTDSGHHN